MAIFFLLIADSSGYLLRKSTFDLKHFEGDVIELVQKTQIKGNILLSLKFQWLTHKWTVQQKGFSNDFLCYSCLIILK